MTQLSTEIFTHSLKIKWEWIHYIKKELAKSIYEQLNDPNTKTVTISNPKTLTYFQKYKTEVELRELKGEEKGFEDTLHQEGLNEAQKDYIREVWNQRKKDRKSTSNEVLLELIRIYKERGY